VEFEDGMAQTEPTEKEESMTDETADLRMAIVRQAADDYIRAKKLLKIQPDNCLAQRTVREVREFIGGKWYATICDINPDFLLRALDAKADRAQAGTAGDAPGRSVSEPPETTDRR